jgi:nucleoside-diphosphate-sugar epimerase
MKRVLVTGATGFIGMEVARKLSERGFRPRLMVRRPMRSALLKKFDAELIQGDLESPLSLKRAVEGVDTVIHLGARAIFEEYDRLCPSIVDGSVHLMSCAIDAGVQCFVYSSSLLVYKSQASAIDVNTPADPTTGYGKAKLEAERELSGAANRSGIAFASIRLPHVYGARDIMFGQVRQGRTVLPGNGTNLFSHLHVADAARILISVAEQKWTGTTPVSDDLPATWSDFFKVVKKYYPHLNYRRVPMATALAATLLLTPFRRMREQPSLYTPEAVRSWNHTLVVKPALLWPELDIQPRYPTIHEGIPEVLDDCLEFRWIHPLEDRLG